MPQPALIVVLGLIGCGPTAVWYSPTQSVLQTQDDLKACKFDANTAAYRPFSSSSIYSGMARVKRRAQIKDCMQSQGYRLTKTKYLESQGLEFFSESPY